MTGFKQQDSSGVTICTGDPNCAAAHAALLTALKGLGCTFLGPSESILQNQRGNFGEFIAFHIARTSGLQHSQAWADNAIKPMTKISGAGIDLTYAYFDPKTSDGDLLYIQEVKTTSAENLNYLANLESDYAKLFSTDLTRTLQSRIQGFANSLEFERSMPQYVSRILSLGAKTAKEASRVRLVPTGVHTLGTGNPTQKMLAIKSTIAGFGWNPSAISPWAVGLSDLEDRLLRLARGQL